MNNSILNLLKYNLKIIIVRAISKVNIAINKVNIVTIVLLIK